MTDTQYDILGIGNAIVDVVAATDDQFLSRHDMHKGAMQLIDSTQADLLYGAMPPGKEWYSEPFETPLSCRTCARPVAVYPWSRSRRAIVCTNLVRESSPRGIP